MRRRTIVSGATLAVLLLVLGAMAVYGFRAATAPLPTAEELGDDCSVAETEVQRSIGRGDVEVSVYNAGTTSGLAGRTMDRLEDAGFVAGEIGNAPEDAEVRFVRVQTTEPDDTAARLVALALGPSTAIDVLPETLGPGIVVVVGDGFEDLDPEAPTELELAEPVERCVRVD